MSTFESSRTSKAAFLHESCFSFDYKNFTQNTTFHSPLKQVFAAFGAMHAFTPCVCYAFSITTFLCDPPQFASPREFWKWSIPLGLSCVGWELKLLLGVCSLSLLNPSSEDTFSPISDQSSGVLFPFPLERSGFMFRLC